MCLKGWKKAEYQLQRVSTRKRRNDSCLIGQPGFRMGVLCKEQLKFVDPESGSSSIVMDIAQIRNQSYKRQMEQLQRASLTSEKVTVGECSVLYKTQQDIVQDNAPADKLDSRKVSPADSGMYSSSASCC